MLMTGSPTIDAQRAFAQAERRRRRAAMSRWIRRRPSQAGRLAVIDERRGGAHGGDPRPVIRAIPLDAILGTTEPSRATLFDAHFRPSGKARDRWERVWLAEQRGVTLPPISVVRVGDAYAIRDGHHRVSVARARGALAIDATVEATVS
jgi:hypothetical protein